MNPLFLSNEALEPSHGAGEESTTCFFDFVRLARAESDTVTLVADEPVVSSL